MRLRKWIKIPGPGQVRGEGEWREFDDAPYTEYVDSYYERCRKTGYLPTAEQEERPAPDRPNGLVPPASEAHP